MTFTSSVDTSLLAERLSRADIGELVTYQDLAEAIGAPVEGGRGRACLTSARRRLQREQQIVFGTVRGIGLRRLSDVEIVEAGAGYVDKVRRTARRGARLVTSVADFQALPPAARQRHNAQLSVFSAMEAVARASTIRRVEERTAAKPLPLAATLDVFRTISGTREKEPVT